MGVSRSCYHAPCIILGHVNPSGYNLVEGRIPKEKRGTLPSRRRRCEKEVNLNEVATGCLQMLGNEGGCSCTFTRERSQAASYAHGRWNRKKEGSVGEKGAESDGGAWGEIRNEREEKPSADEIRGTVSGVWLCIVMAREKTVLYQHARDVLSLRRDYAHGAPHDERTNDNVCV